MDHYPSVSIAFIFISLAEEVPTLCRGWKSSNRETSQLPTNQAACHGYKDSLICVFWIWLALSQKEKIESEQLRRHLMKAKEQLRDSHNELEALKVKCEADAARAASAQEERMELERALEVGSRLVLISDDSLPAFGCRFFRTR